MEIQVAFDPSSPSLTEQRPASSRRTHTFVLRLVIDERDDLHGLMSEPSADDGWRHGFASLEQLLAILGQRLQIGLYANQDQTVHRRDP
jgi:hypothetical protein